GGGVEVLSIIGSRSSCVRDPRGLLAGALAAVALAACAQQSAVTHRSGSMTAARQTSPEPARTASLFAVNRAKVAARKSAPAASDKPAAGPQDGSYGLASYYSYDPKTASGEKFDPH